MCRPPVLIRMARASLGRLVAMESSYGAASVRGAFARSSQVV